jgi:hypothetical protein
MNNIEAAIEKLNRIHELWIQLRHAKFDNAKYTKIIKEIRICSAEFQALPACPNPLSTST